MRTHYRKNGPDIASIMFSQMGAIKMFAAKEGQEYAETQEYRVAKRAKEGDLKAREEMVERNLRLVMSVSKRFTGIGLDHADLVQEGVLGLIRASQLFDPDLGNKFSTYAYWWIRQAMGRAVMQSGRSVRVPVHVTESANKIRKFNEEFYKEFRRFPSFTEVSIGLEIPVAKVKDVAETLLPVISLNKPVTENGQELMEVIPSQDSIEDEIALGAVREVLQKYLCILSPIEAQVLSHTTGFPLEGDSPVPILSAKDLAKLLPRKGGKARTPIDVRIIRAAAMRKLRARLQHSQLMGLKDCLT